MNKRATPRVITNTPFKIVSLRKLAEIADIKYMAVYDTFTNRYDGLTDNQRTRLANALCSEMEAMFDSLGWRMELKRIRKEKV